ncbi:HCP-like protein [Leucogyrophana mollusca]|uniref:HCP-like protein n=1 Tax=Leucogyrophana mollusca TaxID=85980 RepID=A0ACB8BM61_9AGAM|nr:HCP-like protein [Leucogyrophana mollusca]
MTLRRKARSRQATWLAFGLVALAAFSVCAQDPVVQQTNLDHGNLEATTIQSVSVEPTQKGRPEGVATPSNDAEVDQAAEAARAYRSALITLSNLTANPPPYTHDPSYMSAQTTSTTTSFLSSFLPNPQGQGPFGSAIRIAMKLRQEFWLFRILSAAFGQDGIGASGSRKKNEEMRGKAIKVIDLLQHSIELGNVDALYTLAYISLFPPNFYFPLDPALAYSNFVKHASLTGNASSQAMLAFFHATGYHDVVPVDQSKALLYYTFAAQGGHKGAQMALGYRYWSGIGTLEDCGRAVEWYESAAEEAMSMFLSGPPGGRTLTHTATRLSDLDGGAYGPGASVASTGFNVIKPAVKAGLAHAAGETWEDVLEYYIFNADRGETDFAFKLGKIYYQGSIYAAAGGIASGSEGVGWVPQDFEQAQYYFLQIARQVWPRDPPNPLQHNAPGYKVEGVTQPGLATRSAAYLGRMYLRGEGVKADPAMAMMWFERGAEYDERECHNGLGIILRDGLVPGIKDPAKALLHFNHAAGQELAEAQVNMGKHHYGRGDIKLAATYFETAVRYGSTFEAHFYLAKIHSMNMQQQQQSGMPPELTAGSCATALSFYKLVAERGVWDDDLLRDAEVAWYSGTDRGKEIAILKWWVAAERGSEIAQNNLAYVLDQDRSVLRLTRFSPIEASNDTARLALTQWARSAAQRNIDALVKVGDYYYHGLGVPDEPESKRWEKAAKYYQSAADTQVSALAMWNLGWMYENGVGVPQDFFLAKRHYDQALETNSEAYLPVTLSILKLYARSIWHTLQGGKNGLHLWSYDEDALSIREKRELEASQSRESPQQGAHQPEEQVLPEELEEDGPWYLGKAKEEFLKRKQGNVARGEEEDDPVQWARDRRNAENERDSDLGPEDYFDAALRGGHRGEEDVDNFGETLLLVVICLLVAVLMYIRTRLVRREERQDGQGEQQRQNLGVFPQPDDPARAEWNILR